MISVIIPLYNVEKYCSKCFESVLTQSFKDIEIIVVDDGSTDNSGKIADSYVRAYSNFRVFHNSNHGLSYSRNFGVNHSSGDCIFFLDSDDFLEYGALSTLHSLLSERNADIAIGNFDYVTENGQKLAASHDSPIQNGLFSSQEAMFFLSNKYYYFYIVAWNKLYKKSIFSNGLAFPEGINHEDELFTPQAFHKANTIVCTSQIVYHYVQRSKSIIANEKGLFPKDFIKILCKRIQFYENISEDKLFYRDCRLLMFYVSKYWQVYKKSDDNYLFLRDAYKLLKQKQASINQASEKKKVLYHNLFFKNPPIYYFLIKVRNFYNKGKKH